MVKNKKKSENQLIQYPFENYSGISLGGNAVPFIKRNNYKVLDITVGGDAPKDVIKMYVYDGEVRKKSVKSWHIYIAKIGHKWYPNESVTEQLITRIGQEMEMSIAHSELVDIEGTVRFCSRHFHTKDQILNHGAEIISRYLGEKNPKWLDDLDKKNQIKAFIHIEDVFRAIKVIFPVMYKAIVDDFVSMILFDALVGNNDRHYYNWGVVTHIAGKHQPYFSPIYDTARGLMWNTSDEEVVSLCQDENRLNIRIKRYINKSIPKISIPNNEKCNHFDLVEYLVVHNYINESHLSKWKNEAYLEKIYKVIDKEFCKLMTKDRIFVVKKTLQLRYNKLIELLK